MSTIYLTGGRTACASSDCAKQYNDAAHYILSMGQKNSIDVSILERGFVPSLYSPPDPLNVRLHLMNLMTCQGIGLLSGWENNPVSQLELKIALLLKVPIVYLEAPCTEVDLEKIAKINNEFYRYYLRRSAACLHISKSQACADRVHFEVANRFLDPHGFEYVCE